MGLGVALVVIIYLTTNVVPLPAAGGRDGRVPLVAATAAERIPALGAWAANAVAARWSSPAYGNMCGGIMVYPRTQFAMAEQGCRSGRWPGSRRDSTRPRSQSDHHHPFGPLLPEQHLPAARSRFVLGLWPFYCLGVAAVFVLRKSHPELPGLSVWGYPVVPAICLLAAVGMLVGRW
jgi:hypothetical protein